MHALVLHDQEPLAYTKQSSLYTKMENMLQSSIVSPSGLKKNRPKHFHVLFFQL